MNGRDVRTGDLLLGRYRVEGLLGRGGMGVVHRALDERLDRAVAIKLITATVPREGGASPRPQKEARALARLNHPNLVTLLDYDELDDGTPVMVMEYVEGDSLDRLLPAYRFGAAEIALFLHQTAAALATCHEQGVIHRDLKPGNLLVQVCDSPGLRVKVIDFGLTKLLADRGATALTMAGKVFGSPRFMAPEQWLRGDVDGRTDLYALGLVGYCMVLGRHFIAALNPVEIFRAHLQGARPPLTATTDGRPLPRELAAIIERAAQAEASARFPDARAMQAALEPLVRGVRVRFRPAGGAPEPPLVSSPVDLQAIDEAASSIESAPTPPADDDEIDDRTIAQEPPPDLLATVFEAPALPEPDPGDTLESPPEASVSVPVPVQVAERVRFGFSGSPMTAITRGDVERAVQASLQPPAADPPEVAVAVPVEAPRPVSRPPRAAPVAPVAPPAPRLRWWVVGAGVAALLISAIATILLLR